MVWLFKRFQSLLLAVALALSMLCSAESVFAAADGPTVYGSATQALAGEQVRVPVMIKSNTGLLGFKLSLDYDPSVVTPLSVESGPVTNGGLQDNIDGDMVRGQIHVYWAGSEAVAQDGILFYVNFSVFAGAVGQTKIHLSYTQEDTFDDAFRDVALQCEDIPITVTNKSITKYAKFSGQTENVTAGETVGVRLRMDNAQGLTACTLHMRFDQTNFEFLSVKGLNDVVASGVLRSDALVIQISNLNAVPSATDAVEIRLRAKAQADSGEYQLSFSAEQKEVSCTPCTCVVQPSFTSEVARVYADSPVGRKNDTLSIPIKITNNHGLMGYRLRIVYTASDIQPISATCGSQFSGTFNTSIGDTVGQFDVLWNSTDQVIADDILFTLHVKLLSGDSKNSILTLSYNMDDTFNEKYDSVTLDCQKVTIRMNPKCDHSQTRTERAKAATCTAEGYSGDIYCTKCGLCLSTGQVIKKKAHTYKWYTTAATWSKDGVSEKRCAVCRYSAAKKKVYRVAGVKLSKSTYTYNGKVQKPKVTVKDSKGNTLTAGKHYTVSYSGGCKNVGRYSVKLTLKGAYKGAKTYTFTIVPKGTTVAKLQGGKKSLTVKWKAQKTQTTGYQLQYSTSKNFTKNTTKWINVGNNKSTAKTVKKLKAKKKYYVRIRTYKKVKTQKGYVTIYSSWSKVKTVKTK